MTCVTDLGREKSGCAIGPPTLPPLAVNTTTICPTAPFAPVPLDPIPPPPPPPGAVPAVLPPSPPLPPFSAGTDPVVVNAPVEVEEPLPLKISLAAAAPPELVGVPPRWLMPTSPLVDPGPGPPACEGLRPPFALARMTEPVTLVKLVVPPACADIFRPPAPITIANCSPAVLELASAWRWLPPPPASPSCSQHPQPEELPPDPPPPQS